jgi:hypothetical protein
MELPAGPLPAAATLKLGDPAQVWYVDRDTALVDGTMTVTLRRFATEAPDTSFWTVRPALVIRCEEGKTEVFVTVPRGLGGEQLLKGAPVAVTFDSLPPVKERWPASAEGDAVFSPGADAFMAQLKQADTVHLSVTTRGDTAQVSSFAVVGLSEPLRRLAPECMHANWPASPGTIN